MVVRPKHVAVILNKIVNYYWNSVVLGENPWTWYFPLKMVVRPKHVAVILNKIVNYYWNSVALDEKPLNLIFPPEDGRTTETCSGYFE
jgi:hypothetical protein